MDDHNRPIAANDYTVPAISRALDVIEYLSANSREYTLNELVERLGFPKASLFRILHTLKQRGFVFQSDSGLYKIGNAMYMLMLDKRRSEVLPLLFREEMARLARRSGQVTQLSVLTDTGVMYLDAVQPQRELSIIAPLHQTLPVNISAGGKVILAYQTKEYQKHFLKCAKLANQTAKTISNIPDFLLELDRVRERGFGLDDEEYAVGVGCMAMPIWNAEGEVIAAIGTTGQYCMYDSAEKIAMLGKTIRDAAEKATAILTCNP
ncbi:MAG: IclR family transcriptional regulator [Eubacteriales bacterium]|nr:IclR family transcriptional regulator [Eubacteriales bacterium]